MHIRGCLSRDDSGYLQVATVRLARRWLSQGKAQRDRQANSSTPTPFGESFSLLWTFDLSPSSAEHPIVRIIEKDREISGEIVEGDPNRETMNRDIDVKRIKQVPIHNAFAISMILIVIGSGYYFYVRLRRRSRELEAEELAADEAKLRSGPDHPFTQPIRTKEQNSPTP